MWRVRGQGDEDGIGVIGEDVMGGRMEMLWEHGVHSYSEA